MNDVTLRDARVDLNDERFLWRMLADATSWRPSGPTLTIGQAMGEPGTAVYVEGWGREGDRGVVAELASTPAGAAWWRYFTEHEHGYGFIESAVPEMSIAVLEEMRGRGIGTALLEALIERARETDLPALSLSVEFDNPALRLYERFGFIPAGRAGNALTMRLDIRAA